MARPGVALANVACGVLPDGHRRPVLSRQRRMIADVDRGLRVSRTAAGICLLLTYRTNEHVQSWDGEFPFVVDQIALKETRNDFRILVSQRLDFSQSQRYGAG
jgi:hypothetical protein